MAPPIPGRHSDDRVWWWSGTGWVFAWSDDRQWWFDGSTWIRVPPRKTFPAPRATEWGMATVWALLWVIALVWCGRATAETQSGDAMSVGLQRAGLALGLGSLALLPVSGYILGRARRWMYVWVLVAYVWMLLLVLYVVTMLAVPVAGGSDNDTAAGAGLVILGLPMLFIVGVLVGAGAGVGLLVGRRTESRHKQDFR
jgi:hypothetical protein